MSTPRGGKAAWKWFLNQLITDINTKNHISSHPEQKRCRLVLSSAVSIPAPSSGSLTTGSDTGGERLAQLSPPPIPSGVPINQGERHDSLTDARWAMTLNTLSFGQTAARLRQPGLLNDTSRFLAVARCAWWSGGVAGRCMHALHLPHTVYPCFLECLKTNALERREAAF